MFKKIASLVLAATMMASVAAITASAAETDEDAAVAAGESAAVAADDASQVGADSSSSTGASNTISFDVNSTGWGNVKTVFAHVWRADGTGTWPAWQGKAEKCTYDTATGIATYDLSKTGNEISKSDGKVYCVIFSANTGMQTYNVIMSGACIGDTLYSKEEVENPVDNEKKCNLAYWKNNSDCGPQKVINSSGKIFGDALAEGTSDITLLADYLISYYNDDAKLGFVQGLFDELKVSVTDVMASVKFKEEAAVKSGSKTQADSDTEIAAIEATLSKIKDPTTGKEVTKEDLNNVKAEDKSSGSSGSSSSSNSSSSNTSSSSSSSGSSSVKSGQETTIFFVFGGLMITAAGVMFLARRRKEN